MTIFGTGYRGLEFRPQPVWRRALPLALAEFRSLFRTRWGVLLFLLLQGPLIQNLFLLFLRAGVFQIGAENSGARNRVLAELGAGDPTAAAFYVQPVFTHFGAFVATLALTTLVSSRAVARDRDTQALELLWTRGLSPFGYFLAKWAGSAMLLGLGYIGTPLVLWLVAWASVEEAGFLAATLPILPQVFAGLLLFTLLISGLAVGFSALFRGPNVSSIAWVLVLVGSGSARGVLERLLRGQDWVRVVSPWDSARRLGEWVAGLTPRVDFPPEYALASCVVLTALVGFGVSRRLKVTEAVG